jgi:hypothetical protein
MRPIFNKTVQEWLEKVMEEPMPMKYTLLALDKLFNPINFYRRYSNEKLEVLKKNMQKALKDYCEYKKKGGYLKKCEKPVPDPPFPDPLAICRYCFSCGGDYPVTSGASNAEHGSTFEYTDKCKDPFNTESSLPTLCCEKAEEKRQGNCRYCTNCGAEFPTRAGGMTDHTQNYFHFQRDCSGKLGFWGSKNVSLCCSTHEPACSVCETCGGRWPVMAGGMLKNTNSYRNTIFEGRGRACEGDEVRILTDPDNKYLCCKSREVIPHEGESE